MRIQVEYEWVIMEVKHVFTAYVELFNCISISQSCQCVKKDECQSESEKVAS